MIVLTLYLLGNFSCFCCCSFFFLFVFFVLFCCFTSQVNSYGHCGTVSSPNHTISTKVWDRAGIELATPGSAVRLASVARHVTDCATRPGNVCRNKWFESKLIWVQTVCKGYQQTTKVSASRKLLHDTDIVKVRNGACQ